jgi:hypothetical protein
MRVESSRIRVESTRSMVHGLDATQSIDWTLMWMIVF